MTEERRHFAIENTDRIEDAMWDAAVIGAEGSEVGANRNSPLARILALQLGTRDPVAEMLEVSGGPHVSEDNFSEAFDRGRGLNDAFCWTSVRSIPLGELNETFQSAIWSALGNSVDRLTVPQKRRLPHLLFHPLQNVLQHATYVETPHRVQFAGLSSRVVDQILPLTPSIAAYLGHTLGAATQRSQFLEIVVHDDGPGIAGHFAGHRMRHAHGVADYEVYGMEPSHEWNFLKQAFERHTSSKFFRLTVDQPIDDIAFRPGVGLAAMVAAARALRVYMEVRCGRYRAYRWFKTDEKLSRDNLIHPDVPPAPSHFSRGTVLRMFMPLAPS